MNEPKYEPKPEVPLMMASSFYRLYEQIDKSKSQASGAIGLKPRISTTAV
jgi:hypothetical protein